MEANDWYLNRYMDNNERVERQLLVFESEVFDDIKELNAMGKELERLQELYDNKLDELARIAISYGDEGYDFRDELYALVEQL